MSLGWALGMSQGWVFYFSRVGLLFLEGRPTATGRWWEAIGFIQHLGCNHGCGIGAVGDGRVGVIGSRVIDKDR
jgi:hypothetical protein